MISCMISYHIKDLTVSSPEAVAFQNKRVASCLGPWAFHCRAHTPTRCNRMCEAALYPRGWEPGCSPGWRSAPLQSTPRPALKVSAAPAQNSHQSMLQVFLGNQQIIGWYLLNGYSSHPCPASRPSSAQTTSACPGRTSKRAGLRRCTSKHSLPA